PLEATAAELACEIHDAARSSQRGARIREVLHQIAVAVIAHDTQPIVFAERTLVRRAARHVTNGLAGIERDRVRRDLPRILLQLLACQTDRILRVRLIEHIHDRGERGNFVGRESHTEIRNIALRCTVISVPVGLEPRKIAAEINATEPHTELRSVASETVLAGRRRQLEARFLDPIPRDDLNDAAGRVAVQRRERPAQHLDALSAVQVEQSRLALPVRHRQRNAVLDQTDAAHAERSARAESARRDLQVLSVVLAVLHDDAWHASKTLRQVYAQLVLSKDLAVDRI